MSRFRKLVAVTLGVMTILILSQAAMRPPPAFADHGNFVFVEVAGPNEHDFGFTVSFVDSVVCSQQDPFSLRNGQTKEMQCREGARVTITTAVTAPYTFESVDCRNVFKGETEGQQTTVRYAGSSVTLNIADEEHWRCMFSYSASASEPNIKIVKRADGAHEAAFRFSIAGDGTSCDDDSFMLSDDEERAFRCEVPGTYTIREINLPAGWGLDHIACTDTGVADADIQIRQAGAYVAITLRDINDRVTCWFENRLEVPAGPNITVVKDAPGAGSDDFTFSIQGTGDECDDSYFRLEDDEEARFTCRVPGTYTVTETSAASDWTLTAIACSDFGVPSEDIDVNAESVTIRLRDASDRVTCTFRNRHVSHEPDPAPPAPPALPAVVAINAPKLVSVQSVTYFDVQVRTSTGAAVQDGTPVFLTTSYGTILASPVYTANGHAWGAFYAPARDGIAVITARTDGLLTQAVVCVGTCQGTGKLESVVAQCNATPDGRAIVTFNWQPRSGAVAQWLDLTLFDNGFVWGTFLGSGPHSPLTSTVTWPGILPGLPHYWRVNALMPDGTWMPSETGVFYPCY